MPVSTKIDFRSDAAHASELQLLEANAQSLPPYPENLSLCVRQTQGTGFQYAISVAGLIFVLLMFPMVILGFFLLFKFENPMYLLLVAVGFTGFVIHNSVSQILLRRHLKRRGNGLFDPHRHGSFMVNIENTTTKSTLKVAAEDSAIFWADPQSKTIFIDGCHYHYVIRVSDITRVKRCEGYAENGVILVYRINMVELNMTIHYAGQGPIGAILNSFSLAYGTNKLGNLIFPMLRERLSQSQSPSPSTSQSPPLHPPTTPPVI